MLNARRLDRGLNIFTGIFKNTYFLVIMLIMVGGQAIIVNFGGAPLLPSSPSLSSSRTDSLASSLEKVLLSTALASDGATGSFRSSSVLLPAPRAIL
jgi:hypothetical protein